MAKAPTERKGCGTKSGYYWHRNHGEDPCNACSLGATVDWANKHMPELSDPLTAEFLMGRARAAFFEKRTEAVT